MCGSWEMVNQAIRAALEGVTLADMMPAIPDFLPAGSGETFVGKTADDRQPVAAAD